jgi:oligopeptide transport system substrate-binding protein
MVATFVRPIILICFFTAYFARVALAAPASERAKAVRLALQNEPTQLNSTRALDAQSFFILGHIFEGLTRNGPKLGEIVPGIAESWEINDKGATFHLRKNAFWSDGRPVRAADFVFGWRLVVDPKNASEYAFIMNPIKNARAIQQGALPVSALGVYSPDDSTLSVVFEKPCGYFIQLMAFGSFYPVRADFYLSHSSNYGTAAAALLSDGPFVLTDWVHGKSLKLEKNQRYWNASNIKISAIDIPYITPDSSTVFNLYKAKKIDMIERLGHADMDRAVKAHLPLHTFKDGSVWFLEFNFRKSRPTTNLNLRYAIRAAVSLVHQVFLSKVVKTSPISETDTLVPDWISGAKQTFRAEHPYHRPLYTLDDAKHFIDAAKKELGGKIPPLLLLTEDTSSATREAEYFEKLMKDDLGVDLQVQQQSRQSLLARMEMGEFDIISTGWSPDYDDPMTFVDLMASWNANNRGHYSNTEVDRLIATAQGTTDANKRMDAMAAAEKIILDEAVVIPIFNRFVTYVVNEKKIKGVVRRPIGADPDFTRAEWVK